MNRRIVFPIAMLSVGLLIGILIGRWFMPDRYGLLTMILLVLGGFVAGALVTGSLIRAQSISEKAAPVDAQSRAPSEPSAWSWQFGQRRFTVRYNAGWWEQPPTRVVAPTLQTRAAPSRQVLVGCLFGAVILALYGQFAFTDNKNWALGLYAYLFAIVCFVLLVTWLDQPNASNALITRGASAAADTPLQNRWRLMMIVGAVLGACVVAVVGATTAWNVPQTENIVLWFGVSILYACAFLPWARVLLWLRAWNANWVRSMGQRAWQHRVELLLLAGIVAVAGLVRYWHLVSIPPIFGGDEGEMGSEALSILRGDLKNPFVTGWMSHPTMFFFVQSFFLKLIGATVFGLRLPSVVGGTLSVFVTYLLIRRLFTTRLALITAGLLAVYNFHIHFSRLALNNIFDSVSAPLVLLLLYAGLESRRPAYFAASGMAMGLAIYFYHGARLIPIIVGVFVIYLLFTERELILKNILNFVWLSLGALIVAGPLLDFFYLHPADFMARLTQRGIFQSGWFEAQVKSGRTAADIMLDQVRRSFLAFNVFPDPTNWFGTGEPLLDPLSGMFFGFGFVYSAIRLQKKNYALLLIWLVLGVFFGSTLLENPPTSPSFVMVTVPAIFFVALGLEKFVELAARVLHPLARVRLQVAALFVFLFAVWNLGFYFMEYTPRHAYGGEPNWVIGELVNYLQQRHDKSHVYFVAPPYIYLNIGSRKFIMPQLDGEDVLDPIRSADDLGFVRRAKPALFVFVPARAQEFPIVQKAFPGGVVHQFNKPNGNSLFFVYEVNTP